MIVETRLRARVFGVRLLRLDGVILVSPGRLMETGAVAETSFVAETSSGARIPAERVALSRAPVLGAGSAPRGRAGADLSQAADLLRECDALTRRRSTI